MPHGPQRVGFVLLLLFTFELRLATLFSSGSVIPEDFDLSIDFPFLISYRLFFVAVACAVAPEVSGSWTPVVRLDLHPSVSIRCSNQRNEKQDLKKLWCGVEMSKEGSGGGGNGAEQEEEEEKGGEEEKTEMRGGWSRKMTTAA
ncbi:LOW QUALITY PROTEIN: hypothetical protein HID58_008001 [Brassica napus]|nr:LOW QUALITY PROTEIN: hypothetical protein HID58_008001 [Brassica napus]